MKTVKTNKGTVLPLIALKGKDYLQVAHRLQWFVEENNRYAIQTNYLSLSDTETVAKVTVNVFDDSGQLVKTAEGTKRESQKDFFDHTEKAETGALGRALVQLGYGTQYALSDLDEGSRIVDSPVTDVKSGYIKGQDVAFTTTATTTNSLVLESVETPATKAKVSFRKPKAETKPTNGTAAKASEEDFFS